MTIKVPANVVECEVSQVAATAHPVAHGVRIPQLDGMRAVAVLLVFGAHTVTRGFGWQGVHVFFVLSGFLITGILRRSRTSGAYWRTFYIKRAARILPPLIVFFVLGILLYSPAWKLIPAYMLFGANVAAVSRWDLKNAFDVLWSLSVEEHFYLVWPFAVKFCKRASLMWISVALLLGEPLLRIIFSHWVRDPRVIYMLTPFQLDGLAAGSLLALLFEDPDNSARASRWSGPLFWTATCLYASMSLASNSFKWTANSFVFNAFGYSLVVVIAASLLMTLYVSPKSLPSRLLSSAPFVFLGTISYGFYLFHPLMLDFCDKMFGPGSKSHHAQAGFVLTAFVCSVAISWVSFRYYEGRMILLGRRASEAATGKSRHSRC